MLPDMTDGTPNAPDTEPLLTAQEAADLLGVSERTVRRRINAGELPAAKVAGQYRIPASAVGRAPVEHAGHAGRVPDAPVPRDLEPLAILIDDLTRENRQLAEAAAVWQFRALEAEERLLALAAGEPVADAPSPTARPTGLLAWLRRVWRGQ